MSSCLPVLAALLLTAAGSCHGQYTVYRQDPFALLSGTLQTYQRAACDSQVLNLECPVGTKISIQLVQYGRSLPSAQVRPFSNFNWVKTERVKLMEKLIEIYRKDSITFTV